MQLSFDADKHEYCLDGAIVPSVTEICKVYTMDEAMNADRYLRDVAADRGTRIHEACLAYDFGGDEVMGIVDRDIELYLQAYAQFLADYQIDGWELYEKALGSEAGGYAGTLDRYGLIDGRPIVLDIKTGTRINKEYCKAQLGGYRALLAINGYALPEEGWVLQLLKDGKYRIYRWSFAGRSLCLLFDAANALRRAAQVSKQEDKEGRSK